MDKLMECIIEIAILACVVIVTRYLIPWVKAKIGNEGWSRVIDLVNTLVRSAQQMHQDYTGQEKLELVTGKVKLYLDEYGIAMNDQMVRDLIEASVKSMKMGEGKEQPAADK